MLIIIWSCYLEDFIKLSGKMHVKVALLVESNSFLYEFSTGNCTLPQKKHSMNLWIFLRRQMRAFHLSRFHLSPPYICIESPHFFLESLKYYSNLKQKPEEQNQMLIPTVGQQL